MSSRPMKIDQSELSDSTPLGSQTCSASSSGRVNPNRPAGRERLTALGEKDALEIIAEMPKDVGWFLLVGGLATEVGVPGVPPVWIAGILILWPDLGQCFVSTLQRRAPKSFNGCLRMLSRYVHDLEQRYPRHEN